MKKADEPKQRLWQIFTMETARVLVQPNVFYKTKEEAVSVMHLLEQDFPTLKGKLLIVEVIGKGDLT